MKQENCPVCGRLMETLKTESGREVQLCLAEPNHRTTVVFEPDPTRLETGAPTSVPLGTA